MMKTFENASDKLTIIWLQETYVIYLFYWFYLFNLYYLFFLRDCKNKIHVMIIRKPLTHLMKCTISIIAFKDHSKPRNSTDHPKSIGMNFGLQAFAHSTFIYSANYGIIVFSADSLYYHYFSLFLFLFECFELFESMTQ